MIAAPDSVAIRSQHRAARHLSSGVLVLVTSWFPHHDIL